MRRTATVRENGEPRAAATEELTDRDVWMLCASVISAGVQAAPPEHSIAAADFIMRAVAYALALRDQEPEERLAAMRASMVVASVAARRCAKRVRELRAAGDIPAAPVPIVGCSEFPAYFWGQDAAELDSEARGRAAQHGSGMLPPRPEQLAERAATSPARSESSRVPAGELLIQREEEGDSALQFAAAAAIQVPDEQDRWLVDRLWAREGVGVIGGAPKLGKSWVVAHLAVSVASGASCFDMFPVGDPGPVLICSLEGPTWLASDRLRNVCGHLGLDLAKLPISVMTTPSLRIDLASDRARLERAIEVRRPRLLIVDPLVRVHALDENAAGQVSLLLNEFRLLQRKHGLAIAIVHHNRKGGSSSARPGSVLRGSGDLHAFGDSNLYLRERGGRVGLAIEHRAAESPPSFIAQLTGEPGRTHFVLAEDDVEDAAVGNPSADGELDQRLLAFLGSSDSAVSGEALARALATQKQRVVRSLERLEAAGSIVRTPRGALLAPRSAEPVAGT